MIGKKDIALVNTGRKIVKKYKDNFSNFMDHEFYARIVLVNNEGQFVKAFEYHVDADELLDYIENTDFEDLKVDKVILSASGR